MAPPRHVEAAQVLGQGAARHLVGVAEDRNRPWVLIGQQAGRCGRRGGVAVADIANRQQLNRNGRLAVGSNPALETRANVGTHAVRAGAAMLAGSGEAFVDVDAPGFAGAGVTGRTGTA